MYNFLKLEVYIMPGDTYEAHKILRERFNRDGFVIVPDLVTAEEARKLKDAANEVLEEVATSESGIDHGVYVGMSIRDRRFRSFARDPRVLDVIEPVIGPNIMFMSDKVVFKNDESDFGTPWHQDWPYWKGLHKVTLWLALDHIDETNGCLRFIRGSHRESHGHYTADKGDNGFTYRTRKEEAEHDPSRIVSVPAAAGTAVVFHDLTLHASHENHTHQDRYALAITYKDAATPDLEYPDETAAAVVRGQAGCGPDRGGMFAEEAGVRLELSGPIGRVDPAR